MDTPETVFEVGLERAARAFAEFLEEVEKMTELRASAQ